LLDPRLVQNFIHISAYHRKNFLFFISRKHQRGSMQAPTWINASTNVDQSWSNKH